VDVWRFKQVSLYTLLSGVSEQRHETVLVLKQLAMDGDATASFYIFWNWSIAEGETLFIISL